MNKLPKYAQYFAKLELMKGRLEVPEMNTVAKLIIERIREEDSEQYEALLKSIGETVSETVVRGEN